MKCEKCELLEKEVAAMLKGFEGLSKSGMARIDARAWYDYYEKRAKKRAKKK